MNGEHCQGRWYLCFLSSLSLLGSFCTSLFFIVLIKNTRGQTLIFCIIKYNDEGCPKCLMAASFLLNYAMFTLQILCSNLLSPPLRSQIKILTQIYEQYKTLCQFNTCSIYLFIFIFVRFSVLFSHTVTFSLCRTELVYRYIFSVSVPGK